MQRSAQYAHSAASLTHPDLRGWLPNQGSADSDLLNELPQMVVRSRDLVRNHGVAEGALQTITDNVIGVGLRLSSTPDYRLLGKDKAWAEEWSTRVESLWRTWAESTDCDAGASLDFHGLTEQAFRSGWMNGEGLALPLWLPRPGAMYATRIQMVEPDRLSNPMGKMDGARLRSGIAIDQYGAPQGYWIRKVHPGDRMYAEAADINQWEYVPATTDWGRRRVIHVHDKGRVGQSRGKPSLTSVMRQFKVLGDFTNAELKAAVVNAKIAVLTESALGPEAMAELLSSDADARAKYEQAMANRGLSTISMEDGQIIPLELGEKLSGFTPGRPSGQFDPFVTSIFRHIATGLNIPYELLMKDFSRTNYSSARAALIEAWRFFRGRRAWISTYWARPVFELWLEEAVNLGMVEAPDFYQNKAAYCRCRWIGPGRGWIDPVKEADAAKIRMDNNLSTLEAECAEQGLDWEESLEQRATEIKRAIEMEQELGLPEGSLWRTSGDAKTADPEPLPGNDAQDQQGGISRTVKAGGQTRLSGDRGAGMAQDNMVRAELSAGGNAENARLVAAVTSMTAAVTALAVREPASAAGPVIEVRAGDTHVTLPDGCIRIENRLDPLPIEVRAGEVRVENHNHIKAPDQPPPPVSVTVNVPEETRTIITAMPERVTATEIERGKDGAITSSRQVEKDSAQ